MANDANLKLVLKLFLSKETCQENIVSNENRPYYHGVWTRERRVTAQQEVCLEAMAANTCTHSTSKILAINLVQDLPER